MSLASMKSVLTEAQKKGYAVPAFNICNLEYAQIVIETAKELNAPVIIALHPVEIEYAGLKEITRIVHSLVEDIDIPVVMHLDHGDGMESSIKSMINGFSSVMFDGSTLPYEDNIKETAKIVEVAHSAGVDVEAELGLVGGAEGDQYVHINSFAEDELTKPEQALDFVERTNVDSLAVAIGTAHGLYKNEPRIDVVRLKQIRKEVDIPLVLHGGSGTPNEVIVECIKSGICKINIASELKYAYHKGILRAIKENPDEYEPRTIFAIAKEDAKVLLREKFELFGTINKA